MRQVKAPVGSQFAVTKHLVVLVTGVYNSADAPKVTDVGAGVTQVLRSDPK